MARQMIIFGVIMVLVAYLNLSSAQVTFSRDWNPGKRNGAIECIPSARSAATVCHMLLSELRQAVACESRNILKNLQDDADTPTIFSGGR